MIPRTKGSTSILILVSSKTVSVLIISTPIYMGLQLGYKPCLWSRQVGGNEPGPVAPFFSLLWM